MPGSRRSRSMSKPAVARSAASALAAAATTSSRSWKISCRRRSAGRPGSASNSRIAVWSSESGTASLLDLYRQRARRHVAFAAQALRHGQRLGDRRTHARLAAPQRLRAELLECLVVEGNDPVRRGSPLAGLLQVLQGALVRHGPALFLRSLSLTAWASKPDRVQPRRTAIPAS